MELAEVRWITIDVTSSAMRHADTRISEMTQAQLLHFKPAVLLTVS
jgi:hypothetical protein